jgi:hypothetical protein
MKIEDILEMTDGSGASLAHTGPLLVWSRALREEEILLTSRERDLRARREALALEERILSDRRVALERERQDFAHALDSAPLIAIAESARSSSKRIERKSS